MLPAVAAVLPAVAAVLPVVAAVLPVVAAAASVAVCTALLGLLARALNLDGCVTVVATVIGVGIDSFRDRHPALPPAECAAAPRLAVGRPHARYRPGVLRDSAPLAKAARKVIGPKTPSAPIPLRCWNALTAFAVAGPYCPSATSDRLCSTFIAY